MMMRATITTVAAMLAMLAFAACGGRSTIGGAPASPSSVARGNAQVSFTIKLPSATASSAHRATPQYVSLGTQSATVTVTPAGGTASAPVAFNCASGACTGSVQVPVGSDAFAFALYDAPNGTGNRLSQGSATQVILPNVANVVNVTFDAVLDHVVVVPSTTTIIAGTATQVLVNVTGIDPDGYQIIGAGTWSDANGNPVSVSIADADLQGGGSGATALAVGTFTASGGTTLTYNGNSLIQTTLTPTPSEALPHPSISATITYQASFQRYVVPANFVQDIITGPDGAVWVSTQSPSGLVRIAPNGTMTTYAFGNALIDLATDGTATIFVNDGNSGNGIIWEVPAAAPASRVSYTATAPISSIAFAPALGKVATFYQNSGAPGTGTIGTFDPSSHAFASSGSISDSTYIPVVSGTNAVYANVGGALQSINLSTFVSSSLGATYDFYSGGIDSAGDLYLCTNAFGTSVEYLAVGSTSLVNAAQSPANGPHLVAPANDGSVWTALALGDGAQRLVDGVLTNTYVLSVSNVSSVVIGPDGNLWMTQSYTDSVYKVVF
jgi:hypothetical protein